MLAAPAHSPSPRRFPPWLPVGVARFPRHGRIDFPGGESGIFTVLADHEGRLAAVPSAIHVQLAQTVREDTVPHHDRWAHSLRHWEA